ncbi:MAG TPA: hypothetical protein VNG90_00925, partial [Candidatus Acidoferrum sp.]|nr:hypothetical protein [Candidatus Acidoferrum sp.]
TTAVHWNVNSGDWGDIGVALNPAPNTNPDTMQDRLHITAAGDVGINDSSPSNTLKVVGSLCVKSTSGACAGTALGTIYATNTTVQSADLAENYVSSQHLQPGDVVMPANDGDSQAVVKTTGSYGLQTIGIISTQPGVTLNSDSQTNAAHPHVYPVALSGRVPVRVSTENGLIHAGDYLTASSIPGVAMRATRPGQMIGKALEDDTNADPYAITSIMVFVNLSWGDPLAGSDSTTAFQIQNSQGASLLTADTTNMAIKVKALQVIGTLTVDGHIVTGGSTPTVAANVALCSGTISAVVDGNDTSGTITITAASGCVIPVSRIATLYFATPYTSKPRVVISANNLASAQALGFAGDAVASGFSLSLGASTAVDGGYSWNYFVTQ